MLQMLKLNIFIYNFKEKLSLYLQEVLLFCLGACLLFQIIKLSSKFRNKRILKASLGNKYCLQQICTCTLEEKRLYLWNRPSMSSKNDVEFANLFIFTIPMIFAT